MSVSRLLGGVVLDERRRLDADDLGNLRPHCVGDFLGLRLRAVDADEPGRVAAAARPDVLGPMPAVAELHEPFDLRPVGAVEEPEVGRRPRCRAKISVDPAASSRGRPAPEWPHR